jgi:hypothetical protein
MSLGLIGAIFTINQEETMDKVKQLWALAVANKKIAIGVVIAIIIIISLVN